MSFIKDLVEKPLEAEWQGVRIDREDTLRYRQFEPIRLSSNLWVSFQASCVHYCKPKETIDLDEYTHWEIALFDDRNFMRVTDVLPQFSSLAEIELYEQGVYAFVPMDLVEELYIELKKVLQVADK